jgi:hypothetical protein
MRKQFPDVESSRGAPMGRMRYGIASAQPPHSVRLFIVRIDSGGYDDGGAYWGIGMPLWCAVGTVERDESGIDIDYRDFVRADDRRQACNLLGLRASQLIRGHAPERPMYRKPEPQA